MSVQKSYWHKVKCANNNATELSVFESVDSSDTAVTIDRQGKGKKL